MMCFNLYKFLMCALFFVVAVNAQRFDRYTRDNYLAYSGRAFGEGVLRPGYDQGEGYLTELDAPSFSAPSVGAPQYYG